MPWSGPTYIRDNGTFTGPSVWNSDATTVEFILADRHDIHDQDLANGITACLNKNGLNTPTANIGWGGFKITGYGSASANTDVPNYGQTLGNLSLDLGTFVMTASDRAGSSIATVDLSPLASGGGGGGAPVGASYVTLSLDGGLTNERVLVGTAGQIAFTDGGAGGNLTASLVNTAVTPGTYSLATVTVDSKGRITAASSGTGAGITSLSGIAPITVSGSGASRDVGISPATTGSDGSMSAADKAKLDGIGTGANVASVFGRTGAVTAQASDYTIQQIANVTVSTAAPSGSPADGALWFRVP